MMFGMRVRGGLFAALVMFAAPVAATLAAVAVSAPARAQTVDSITVEENRRVELETIRSYFHPGPGGRLGQAQIDDGLKALIETGLFQDVHIDQRGGRLVVVDRWFPSSKTCSACGYVVDKLPLSKREWTCPECGSVHQRDANAAINLELVGVTNPEPSPDDPVATRGEIAALAVGRPAVKPWSVTRELQPDARAREVSASSQRK